MHDFSKKVKKNNKNSKFVGRKGPKINGGGREWGHSVFLPLLREVSGVSAQV